jgi:hypothetical protein
LKTENRVISDKVFAIFVGPFKQSNEEISIFILSFDDQIGSIKSSWKFEFVSKVCTSLVVFSVSIGTASSSLFDNFQY